MQQISVYKASAGSGKTFRLALEYLKLLLLKPNAHRNILAVSFTNKATSEMKQRILGELYGIANRCESSNIYLEILMKETDFSEDEIREKSAVALNKILHDYGFFNVETIDSFYQRVLRNMAKELGLGAYFNIELDNQKALKEAVRALIQDLSKEENKKSLDWICKIIEDDAANEKYSKSIEKDLIATGTQIFEEVFKRHQSEIETFFDDKNRVDKYIKSLYLHRKQAIDAGVSTSSTGSENLTTADTEALEVSAIEVNSCDLVLNHLRNMGLLSDISKHLNELNAEQNRFLLAETSALLSKLIGENDTPFLYEKIGANLNHILIDEFQDTSDLQWKNFKLLFLENLSKGYSNLIVGDVKQAIYRWRNSNWETLNSIENEFYEGAVDVKFLEKNYRTDFTIVKFNNALFQKAISSLKQRFVAEISGSRPDLVEILEKAYADVEQIPHRKEKRGFVDVRFVEKDGRKSQQTQAIIDTMLKLKDAKIKPEDIMILVRNKSSIAKISEAFETYISNNFNCRGKACLVPTGNPKLDEGTKNYFKLVSDEAFKLSSSSAVSLIIDALRTLSNYRDDLAFAQLAFTYQSQKNQKFNENLIDFFNSYRISKDEKKRPFAEFLPENFIHNFSALQKLPLYELTEKIIATFGLFEYENQHAFLYDFLDCVNTFVAETGRGVACNAPTTTNITEFLEYWTDELQNKTITINAQISGVRILTIHKSKGLEFHTVVVPFCEWDMDETRFDQLVWHEKTCVETDNYPSLPNNIFNQMPLIPLNYGKPLKHSHFTTDFENETLKLWVDNLNLLYVALTRPKHNLLILADALPKKSEKLRVSNLLHNFTDGELISSVETHGISTPLNDHRASLQNDGNIFKMQLESIEIPFSIVQKQPTFYLSKDAIKWYCEMENESLARTCSPCQKIGADADVRTNTTSLQKGLLYHQILANIRYSDDIENTIEKFIFDGFISENERENIAKNIRELLNNPKAQDWFSKKHKIFSEQKIVNRSVKGHLEQRRPDRVMQDEDGNLILVDFKTGQKYPKHHEQIREYSALLEQMYSTQITGFLWYLDTNEIENVL
jgi:ATP-dependent exoDNAse (exonuclease V) beta subunit